MICNTSYSNRYDDYIISHWPVGVPEDCALLTDGLDCLELNRSALCKSCQTYNQLTNQFNKENPNAIQR